MKYNRLDEEEAFILKNNRVSINELKEKFNVSSNTIRRDIIELEERGKVSKKHGYVISKINDLDVGLLPFYRRNSVMRDEKDRIAKKASEFIEDGDCIFIDSGSTVAFLIDYIKDLKLTVFTNNLYFINKVINYKNIEIITFSGILNRDYFSFTGIEDQAIDILSQYNFTKAFMAATGMNLNYGVMNSLVTDNAIKKSVVKRAQEVYLLVDHSKFNKTTMKSYCQLNDINFLITDEDPPENIKNIMESFGCKIIIS